MPVFRASAPSAAFEANELVDRASLHSSESSFQRLFIHHNDHGQHGSQSWSRHDALLAPDIEALIQASEKVCEPGARKSHALTVVVARAKQQVLCPFGRMG